LQILFVVFIKKNSCIILWLVGNTHIKKDALCARLIFYLFQNMKSKGFSLAKKSRLRAQQLTAASRPPQPRPRRGIRRGPTPMDIDRPLGFPMDWDPMEINDPLEGETMDGHPCHGSPLAGVVIGGHPPPKKKKTVEPTGKLLSSLFFLVEYKYFN
jgi:hypothetical protein